MARAVEEESAAEARNYLLRDVALLVFADRSGGWQDACQGRAAETKFVRRNDQV